jgi:hypothetical protein
MTTQIEKGKKPMKVFVLTIVTGILVVNIVLGFAAKMYYPKYTHVGYMDMTKDEALQYVAEHNKDGSSVATYNGGDNWSVTYNFEDSNPAYNGITSPASNVERIVLIILTCLIGIVNLLILFRVPSDD